MADSVEILCDMRTRVKRLGAKEKAWRKKCKVRCSLTKQRKAFQKSYMKVDVKKLLCAGMMPSWDLGSPCSGDGSHGEVGIKETDGSSSK